MQTPSIEKLTGTPAETWGCDRAEIDKIYGVEPLPVEGGWGYSREDACIIVSP